MKKLTHSAAARAVAFILCLLCGLTALLCAAGYYMTRIDRDRTLPEPDSVSVYQNGIRVLLNNALQEERYTGEYPELPVVIISSNDHPRVIRRAQQFGAAGFIPKSAPAEAMGDAIQAVLDGGSWFPPMAAERSEADAALAAKLAQLTPQQFRVLLCLADGLLNKQIAHELGLAENTVKVHVTAILKKLECYSRTQAAVLVKSLETEPEAAP